MNREEVLNSMDKRYSIFGGLFLLSTKLETIGNVYLKDITTKQWFLLANLTSFFSSPPTISELANQMGSSHQNVKQVALRLQEKGFLLIEKDINDKRTSRLILTDKCKKYSLNNKDRDENFISNLFKNFTEEELNSLYKGIYKLYEDTESIESEVR